MDIDSVVYPEDPRTSLSVEDDCIYLSQIDQCPDCGSEINSIVSFSLPRARLVAKQIIRLCDQAERENLNG